MRVCFWNFRNSVSEIKANEEYTVGFISNNREMLLEVVLSANFPNEKPKIVITPRLQHEWIPDAATGEIQTAPGLLNVNIFKASYESK